MSILNLIAQGENSSIEFKQVEVRPDSLAYQSIDGKYWLRVGSTNRMATKEELSRLFQQAGLVYYDIAPRNTFLLKYLDNMKFIDGLGRGVPMSRRQMEGRFLYQEQGELLRLSFYI